MFLKLMSVSLLAGLFFVTSAAWGQHDPVEEEVVFSQVTRVMKSNDNCLNGGAYYDFTVTGIANGAEKTIVIRFLDPNGENNLGKGESKTVDFCEKAALLTKVQPDKHDLYMKVRYQVDDGSGGPGDGLCPGMGVQGRVRGTQIQCELR